MPPLTINSSPASWSNSQALTFAIPAATTAVSGSWVITSTVTGWISGTYTDTFQTGAVHQASQMSTGNGAWSYTLPLTAQQLADVTAASGSNLSVSFSFTVVPGLTQSISACTLVLNNAAPVGGFPNPSWGYGFQANTPMTAINLATPAGGVGISNNGTNAAPAALTTVFNFSSAGTFTTSAFIATIVYAGQYISISVDTSPNGTSWTTQDTANIGSDHSGVFTSEQITYNFPTDLTAAYLRISFQELPQTGDGSLMTIESLPILNSSGDGTGIGSSFCNQTGSFSITGKLFYGSTTFPGVARENFPLTMWVKECTTPNLQPCAHQCQQFISPQSYCQVGQISTQSLTTDCSGNFTISLGGCLLGISIALGNWIVNPAFNCQAPALTCPGTTYSLFDPSQNYIPDATTWEWIQKCGGVLGDDITGSGTAVGVLIYDYAFGGVVPGTGGVGDAYVGCIADQLSPCGNFCNCGGCYSGTAAIYLAGTGDAWFNDPGGAYALPLTGSYTLNLYTGCGQPELYIYYINDGLYFEVQGVYYDLTDACGNQLIKSASPSDNGFDWFQFATCSISNWTTNCSPPINTNFTGPAGGTLKVLPGTAVPRLTVQSAIYPTYDGLIPQLCPQSCPVLGIQVQSPCTTTIAETLQTDSYKDVLAVSWIESTGALITSLHRSPSAHIGSSTAGWETNDTVESSGASELGMVYLPNESLYMCYEKTGTPVYRVNQQLGGNGQWSVTGTPSPNVASHSASGRGQQQAFRFRSLGSSTANGDIQFSQCRDNLGASWTTPVTVVSGIALGPYCAGCCFRGRYICLFTPAVNVVGPPSYSTALIYQTFSDDGGVTWSAPSSIGFGGYPNGMVVLDNDVLIALIATPFVFDSVNGYSHGFVTSHNGYYSTGPGWTNIGTRIANPIPFLTAPAVLASQRNIAYCVFVTGAQPQFRATVDTLTWI